MANAKKYTQQCSPKPAGMYDIYMYVGTFNRVNTFSEISILDEGHVMDKSVESELDHSGVEVISSRKSLNPDEHSRYLK